MSLGPEGMLPRGRSAGGLLFWAFQAASGSASVGGAVHCEALRLARCRWMATPHLPIRAAAAGGGARPQQPATGTAPVRAGSTGRTRHASGRGDVPVLGSAARRRRQGRLGGTGRLARAPTEGAEPRRHSSRPVPYAAPAPTPGGTSAATRKYTKAPTGAPATVAAKDLAAIENRHRHRHRHRSPVAVTRSPFPRPPQR